MSSATSEKYLHRFSMKHDWGRSDVIKWCQENVRAYWRPVDTYWLHIYIMEKSDAMLFKLVWHDGVKRYKEPEL